jgi:ketosteroid isomerase-like protein
MLKEKNMEKPHLIIQSILLGVCLLCCSTIIKAQSTENISAMPPIDLEKARAVIANRDKQFSKYLFNGDSLALVNMYTKDAQLGTSKGTEIPSTLGSWVRSSIKDDTRNVTFTTTSLTSDGEFLIEVGYAETKDSLNKLKHKGKYLVVWKQENEEWKLYRDIGL